MTEEERNAEGRDESIEDLEAPAAAIDDVAGGRIVCTKPTCLNQSSVSTFCLGITCQMTTSKCENDTSSVVLMAR